MPTLEDFLTQYLASTPVQRTKFLTNFIMLLSEPQLTTLVRKLEELTLQERRSTSQHLSQIVKDETVRSIIQNISSIRDDGIYTKEDIYERVALFTDSSKRPTASRVHLKKRMMVHVDFAGLGTEHKGNHPAIVWHVENSNDRVLVIPCTSFKMDSTVESAYDINIGPAKFLGPNNTVHGVLSTSTVVLLDQIQPVSRKRIANYHTRNPANGSFGNARIDEIQARRIEEGLQVLMHGKKTLYEEFIYEDETMIPEFQDHELQYKHLFRVVRVLSDQRSHIDYMVEDDANTYILYKRPAKATLSSETRKDLLKKWIKPKAIRNPDKTIRMVSPAVRDTAYAALLQQVAPAVQTG
ncbi:hypothetical protein Back11_50100 [Paenibacillus baekrokdamisoli]|uniref:Uncharacterized protein n=1 Tax=Paenibacillus baekrokdamisoli TaxID=1712516 RepID=A0A3G9J5M3_9BACL|nr:type II toxin-antitoxin system PemK/MazF family toxin [Paenibacillus baekrokdamisoli]MBB3068839.1 mRNA-degrading endonuclease toxin of MazEF toxin-antitoxin module [Paenibacillus baekrokdamisoli]BBH23665.1 hypothetical protein Back11_50100 [Paenibacillus baekrokdamisoli]